MESKLNESNDQAAELRKLLDEVEHKEDKQSTGPKKAILPDEDFKYNLDVDVLNLPPRKEIHTLQKRTQVKISPSFMRFLTVIIILSGVLLGAYYLWGNELINLIKK